MKERPILFSGPMVRAILDGSKTQTRRVIKPQPQERRNGWWEWGYLRDKPVAHLPRRVFWHAETCKKDIGSAPLEEFCTYGAPGDALWVRETHIAHGYWYRDAEGEAHFNRSLKARVWFPDEFKGKLEKKRTFGDSGWYTRPSIFMPRHASRILLPLVNVKAERLQDISKADARAEGIQFVDGLWKDYSGRTTGFCDPRKSFETLWDSINGKKHPWRNNDWVWVPQWEPYKRPTPTP